MEQETTSAPDVKNHFARAGTNTEFLLCWHGHAIAYFTIGATPKWESLAPGVDDLFVKDERTRLPVFIRNLRPEGWLREHLDFSLQTDYIRDGLRFLSNLVIYSRNGKLNTSDQDGTVTDNPLDIRTVPLASFTDENGVFTGRYNAPRGLANEETFDEKMEQFWEDKHMPRFSGAELKVPACLADDGSVSVAINDRPFNMIAKHPGTNGYEGLGVNEFLAMSMAKASGLETPNFALVDQGEYPPLYLIERYDIPDIHSPRHEWLLTQDFCTLTGRTQDEKTKGSVEQLGKKIREVCHGVCTPQKTQENLDILFRRMTFSWCINDADTHLKNISLLYKYDSNQHKVTDISFAPCYDATTDVFQNEGQVQQDLSIDGRNNRLKMDNFVNMGKNLGIAGHLPPREQAAAIEGIVRDIAERAARAGIAFADKRPNFTRGKDWSYDVDVQVSHTVDRARDLGVTGLEWDSKSVWKKFKEKNSGLRRGKASRRYPAHERLGAKGLRRLFAG